MADIFISYSSQDPEHTVALAADLEARGYSTWWDTKGLLPGDDFPDVIERAIDAAKVVIVIWTSNSVGSHWVKCEAKRGHDQKKLITVHGPGFDPGRVPLQFNILHCEPVANRDKLYAALRARGVTPMCSGFTPAPRLALHPSFSAYRPEAYVSDKPSALSAPGRPQEWTLVEPQLTFDPRARGAPGQQHDPYNTPFKDSCDTWQNDFDWENFDPAAAQDNVTVLQALKAGAPAYEEEMDADYLADEEDEFQGEEDEDFVEQKSGGSKKLMITIVLIGAVVTGGGLGYLCKWYFVSAGDESSEPSITEQYPPLSTR